MLSDYIPGTIQNEIARPAPVNQQKEFGELFSRSSRFTVSHPEILHLKNCLIFWQGQTFIDFTVFSESLSTPLFINKYTRKFLFLCLLKAVLRRDIYFLFKNQYLVVHNEWSSNYFHWLTDTLTRLYLAKDFLRQATLIIPERFSFSYHKYTLEKFGITKVWQTNDKKIIFAKRVVMPAHTSPAENPALLRAAIEFLTRDKKISPCKYGVRIYISRRNASVRKILNETELINCITLYGFTILNIEEFNFEDQVNILSQAKFLVSIHGAGLTNLMFMPSGSSILELRKKDGSEIYNNFFNLSAVFNQRYFYQPCESDTNESVQNANIFVDLEKLQQNLVLMGLSVPNIPI